jgi:hypothetical protein
MCYIIRRELRRENKAIALALFEMRGETVRRCHGVFARRVRFELAEEFKVWREASDSDASLVGFVPNAVRRRGAVPPIFYYFLFRR